MSLQICLVLLLTYQTTCFASLHNEKLSVSNDIQLAESPVTTWDSVNLDPVIHEPSFTHFPIQPAVNCSESKTCCKKGLKLQEVPIIPPQTITLDLRHNVLQNLPKDSFTNLVHLKVLILSSNAIVTITSGVFLHQRDLTYLDLGDNALTSVNGGILQGLASLTTIRITGNPLSTLGPQPFSDLPKLSLTYLDIVQLSTFKHDLYAPRYPDAKTTPKAAIETNSLKCDSSNCWLKDLESRGFTDHYSVNGKVMRPECSNLPGQYWDEVPLDCDSTVAGTANHKPTIIVGTLLVVGVIAGAVICYRSGFSCRKSKDMVLVHSPL